MGGAREDLLDDPTRVRHDRLVPKTEFSNAKPCEPGGARCIILPGKRAVVRQAIELDG